MPINLSGSLILTGSLTATSSINTPVVNSPLLQNGSQYIAQDTITGITAIVNGVKSWGFYPGGTLQPAGAIVGSTFDATSVDVTQNVLLLKSLYYGAQIVTAPDGVTTQTWNFKTDGNLELPTGKYITGSLLGTASYAANADLLDNRDSSTFANTGSNTFDGGQYLSSSFNPTGFSTTASLYTDGGLRVTRDAYISGTLYLNNVTVYGTQSVCYITSSQLNIASNLITVNTATPSVQFGGLAVYDSGSTGLTGSLLWDSQNNHWIYSNPSGSSYSGGMFISGPRTSTLGSETGTTSCMLLAGQGGDHLTSSMIYHSSTATCIPNTLIGSTICSTMTNASCIGIGTQTPSTALEVNSTDLNNIFVTNPSTTGTTAGSGIGFKAYNGTSVAQSAGIILTSNTWSYGTYSANQLSIGADGTGGIALRTACSAPISFFTGCTTAGLSAERMRITNGGKVGIGTSTPCTELTVIGNIRAGYATNVGLTIGLTPVGVPNNDLNAYILWGDNSSFGGENGDLIYVPRTSTTGAHRFYTGAFGLASEKVRITSSGYVGIGLTSPTAQLHICSAFSQTPLTVQGGGNGNVPIACFMSGPNQLALLDDNGNWILGGTSFSTRSTCTSGGLFTSGRVGLGTTNISSEANLYLGAQGTNEGGQLVLQKGTSCSCATHLDNYQDKFRVMSGTNTGSTNVNMSINHVTGYVGINQDTPTTQLQIRKNYWQFWTEKSHGSNVALFSVGIPVFGAAIIQIAGSKYSPGADNYIGFSTIYIRTNNVGAVQAFSCDSGTYQPSYYISGNSINFCSLHAGSGTNYTGVSVSVQASGHNNGSEAAVSVTLL